MTKLSPAQEDMTHIGWVVRECGSIYIDDSFARTRRETIARYTRGVMKRFGQPDRTYANEKKLGYVDGCVKVYTAKEQPE